MCRYAGLTTLPAGFVEMVKKYNPHITELELSRCVQEQLQSYPRKVNLKIYVSLTC